MRRYTLSIGFLGIYYLLYSNKQSTLSLTSSRNCFIDSLSCITLSISCCNCSIWFLSCSFVDCFICSSVIIGRVLMPLFIVYLLLRPYLLSCLRICLILSRLVWMLTYRVLLTYLRMHLGLLGRMLYMNRLDRS